MKAATKKVESQKGNGGAKVKSGVPSPNELRRQTIEEEGLDGETVLPVRMKNAEFLEFVDQVEAAGLKNNRALRIAAHRIGSFLEMYQESLELLRDVTKYPSSGIWPLSFSTSSIISQKPASVQRRNCR